MATHAPTLTQTDSKTDFLPLKGTDHVEFYVGNARQAAHFYRTAFGMSLVAYAGPETGQRDRASYVLQQGKIRFVLTTALRTDSDIARHVDKHGDGVRAIALWVDDARQAWLETKGFFISVSILDGWEELFFKSYLVCFYRDGRFWGLTGNL